MIGILRFGLSGYSEGWSGYADSSAVVVEAVQEGIHQWFTLEEVVPLGVIEVGCDDG